MKPLAYPGAIPDGELKANFRVLIGLRWVTAAGAMLVALLPSPGPGQTAQPVVLLILGLVHLILNSVLWYAVHRTSLSLRPFVYLQCLVDLVTMGVSFHVTGGIESPYLIYFVVHLFGTALVLSRRAAFGLVPLATALLGAIALLEYRGVVPHRGLWAGLGLFRDARYIGTVLVVFSLTTLLLFVVGISVAAYLRRQRREAVALYQAAQMVTSTLDVNEVLQRLLETCAQTLNATAGVVRLLSPDGNTLRFAVGYGLSDSYIHKGNVNLSDSVIDQQAASGVPQIIRDVRTEQRFMYKSSMLQEGILSGMVMAIPGTDGHAMGVLRVYSSSAHHFTQNDIPFLTVMTAQTGIALSNALQYQQLAEKDKTEARFLRTVTHELRTPIAGAQSLVTSLSRGYVGQLTKQQAELLSRVEKRLGFLQDLITDLLDLARGKEQHAVPQAAGPLDITSSLKTVCDTLRDQARGKSITLETNADLLPPLWINADQEGLRRILINLIGNAIKYTPEEGRVSATLGWDETWVDLTVSDTGIGIAEEDLPHLFEEFFRAKNAREMEAHGTGLGLSIARHLIESLDGKIEVRSTSGEGTTFTVHLPLLSVNEMP